LYDVSAQYPIVAVVGLGSKSAGFNEIEDLDESKENVRKAIASGVSALQKLEVKLSALQIDGTHEPQAAAEGAQLSGYQFNELKQEKSREKQLPVRLAEADATGAPRSSDFERGLTVAKYQNICRRLKEMPANLLTPTRFAEEAVALGKEVGIKVTVHDREWAENKGMNAFLSVTNGSVQPPKFVELSYMNATDAQRRPIVFVGKGITFDSGGISLKPSSNMDAMRADMGGAANVLSSICALAALKSKINIIGLIPLAENMPSGSATKPGDVVVAMNGKTIQVNNTDAEGRLILADALTYADSFEPELVVDIATLTGAVVVGLGQAASAVFSTSQRHWDLIHESGQNTGDRVWRMPLFAAYARQTKEAPISDLNNISKQPSYGGGSSVAACFLKEFTTATNWMHIDMAGTMSNSDDIAYLGKGMTGRPLRTLVHFFQRLADQKA
jgi:aminopeptidase